MHESTLFCVYHYVDAYSHKQRYLYIYRREWWGGVGEVWCIREAHTRNKCPGQGLVGGLPVCKVSLAEPATHAWVRYLKKGAFPSFGRVWLTVARPCKFICIVLDPTTPILRTRRNPLARCRLTPAHHPRSKCKCSGAWTPWTREVGQKVPHHVISGCSVITIPWWCIVITYHHNISWQFIIQMHLGDMSSWYIVMTTHPYAHTVHHNVWSWQIIALIHVQDTQCRHIIMILVGKCHEDASPSFVVMTRRHEMQWWYLIVSHHHAAWYVFTLRIYYHDVLWWYISWRSITISMSMHHHHVISWNIMMICCDDMSKSIMIMLYHNDPLSCSIVRI